MNEVKLSDGRYVEYRTKEELLIADIDRINVNHLDILKDYLTYFSGIIYVEKSGQLEGIMTSNEIAKSIALSRVVINTNFFRVEDFDDKKKNTFFEVFFDKHPSIHCIPVVQEKKLLGEFVLHIGMDDPFNKMQWNPIATSVNEYFKRMSACEGRKRIIAISNSDECIELREILSTFKNNIIVDISAPDADVYICGKKEIRESFQDIILGQLEGNTCLVNIYNLYRRCIVQHILKICREKGVCFFYFEAPVLEKIRDVEELEREALVNAGSFELLITDEQILDEFYKGSKSEYYIKSGDYKHISLLDRGRYFQLCDYQGEYLNIIDGKRFTCNNPENYELTVHIFGNCVARGHCVCDEETIESFLQSELNRIYPERYRVINYGLQGCIGNLNDFHRILYTPIREQDIVICIGEYEDDIIKIFEENEVSYYELSALFSGLHGYGRWFLDNTCHISPVANKAIAQCILKNIEKCLEGRTGNQQDEFVISEENIDINFIEKNKLMNYIDEIKRYCGRVEGWNRGVTGAIVMNCNPFTNGHQYLIEQCALQVDTLLVFVVEEDKSYFPFKDRIKLVREGTKQCSNVIVLPSGRFMISSLTFPEYFNKNLLQEVSVDASQDIHIFGKYIAPELKISIRFAGEEPFDQVTASYNVSMQTILPKYGIQFVEIPRKCFGDTVISASHVRKLLENSEWDQIEKIVPITTYRYLRKISDIT